MPFSTYVSNVNVGSSANDGTGDPLRTAFGKINSNFATLDAYISANYYTKAQVNALIAAYTQNAFTRIAVAGQSDIVANSNASVLTFVAGSGITLSTDPATDSLTIVRS